MHGSRRRASDCGTSAEVFRADLIHMQIICMKISAFSLGSESMDY